MINKGFILLYLYVALGVLTSGCGPANPITAPVTGVVTFNNKPIAGAQVLFMGERASRVASGVTDSQGKFTLTTYEEGDGAISGSHRVSVSKIESGPSTGLITDAVPPPPGPDRENRMKGAKPAKNLLPEKYASPLTSRLTAEVKIGENNSFTFDLTD